MFFLGNVRQQQNRQKMEARRKKAEEARRKKMLEQAKEGSR